MVSMSGKQAPINRFNGFCLLEIAYFSHFITIIFFTDTNSFEIIL